MFQSAGLVARFDKRRATKLAQDLARYLTEKGLEVYAEDTLRGKIGAVVRFVPLSQMMTDFLVTIGGDGTILRTCIAIPKPEPPILAVNMSIRGFLTEVEPRQAFAAIDKCLKGEFKIERSMKLTVSANGTQLPDALNEVVVLAQEPTKLLYTRVIKNGEPILNCQADGLMVSTQTGSTGYSLSAGGPVLDPAVDAFVLTPLCALSTFRPIVFPATASLTIEVERPKKVLALVDGHYTQPVESKLPVVKVTSSKHQTSFIRFRPDFYKRLESRLFFKKVG